MNRIRKALSLMRNNPKPFLSTLIGCGINGIKYILDTSNFSNSPVQKRINGLLFEFDFDLSPMIKQMYFGIYEIETIWIMKQILRPGDCFIDVGANIGYLSCIGAGLVGKTGMVHSFEPVQSYFQRLRKMALTNSDYTIITNPCALGEVQGTARLNITNSLNIGWNTMVPNFMKEATIKESIEVPICRLDKYIKEKALHKISLIKIDVEGFEFPVLKGLEGCLSSAADSPDHILVEIAPAAYPRLGITLDQLSQYMKKYHYDAFSLCGNTKIDITNLQKTTNILFKRISKNFES